MKQSKKRNSFLLLLTAFIWGTAFVAQSKGGDAIGPFSFNCIRSFIGAFILIPVILFIDKQTPQQEHMSRKSPAPAGEKLTLALAGISCGTILFIASSLQQLGLFYGSTAGKAGFLTACYILLVPILGIFLKKHCDWNIWVGVFLALIGLYLLCMNGHFTLQLPDLLLLLCALFFAVHILVIDYFSPKVDGVRMSCIQFLVCGILSAFPMIFSEMQHTAGGITAWISTLSTWNAWIPLLYTGVLSNGVGYTLQIIGQKGVNPTIASLLLSFESVFSVLAGWILLNQKMGIRELTGCLLIFIAVLLAQIPVKDFKRK